MRHNEKTVPEETIRDGQLGYTLWRELPTLQAALTMKGSPENTHMQHEINTVNAKGTKRGNASDSWDMGVKTTEHVSEFVKNGWPEGIVQLKGATKHFKATKAVVIKRKRRMGAEGEFVDPHKVISGNLETAWESRKRTHKPATKHVTLWCEVTTASNKRAEQMIWRGIAAAAATKLLQDAGYRVTVKGYVQLTNLASSGPKRGPTLLVFTAKRGDEMLNLPRLTYLLAHASAYRTLGFHYKRSLPMTVDSWLGIVDYGPPKAGVMGPNDACISNVWTKEAALAWVRETIQRVNGNLK